PERPCAPAVSYVSTKLEFNGAICTGGPAACVTACALQTARGARVTDARRCLPEHHLHGAGDDGQLDLFRLETGIAVDVGQPGLVALDGQLSGPKALVEARLFRTLEGEAESHAYQMPEIAGLEDDDVHEPIAGAASARDGRHRRRYHVQGEDCCCRG